MAAEAAAVLEGPAAAAVPAAGLAAGAEGQDREAAAYQTWCDRGSEPITGTEISAGGEHFLTLLR